MNQNINSPNNADEQTVHELRQDNLLMASIWDFDNNVGQDQFRVVLPFSSQKIV